MKAILVLVVTAAAVQAANLRIGSALVPRMELVYSSEGVETPWSVDSVTRDTTLGGRSGCVRMRLRTSPTAPAAETRAFCSDSTTMYAWDGRELRPTRHLKPNSSAEFRLSAGRTSLYETGALQTESISGQPIVVIPTTVTTRDSTGRITSRLRERFSVALATATGGIFETPDTSANGGWRVTRRFDLVGIRTP
jgi:hypothetical protein